MVVTADDVGDAHHGIVYNGREVIRWRTVGAEDDKVIELFGIEDHVAVDRVMDHHVASVRGNLDAQDVGFPGIDAGLGLIARKVAAAALIPLEWVLACLCGGAVRCQLLGRAETGIGAACVPQLLGGLFVHVEALGLGIRPKVTAYLGALVPIKAQPTHGAQDDLGVFVRGAGRVRIVDAQDEGAAVRASECPVVDSRAGAADVQLARRGGREADSNARSHVSSRYSLMFVAIGIIEQPEPKRPSWCGSSVNCAQDVSGYWTAVEDTFCVPS